MSWPGRCRGGVVGRRGACLPMSDAPSCWDAVFFTARESVSVQPDPTRCRQPTDGQTHQSFPEEGGGCTAVYIATPSSPRVRWPVESEIIKIGGMP